MQTNIFLRIVIDIALIIFVFTIPWWLVVPAIIISMFFVHEFYESILFGMLLDGFHGVPGVSFYGYNALFLSIISAALLLVIFIKPRLTFYDA
jgi:hypothetical protein